MPKFLNLKIPVENNLDEIVGELEKRGYKKVMWDRLQNTTTVLTYNGTGWFTDYSDDINDSNHKLTTLAELKAIGRCVMSELNYKELQEQGVFDVPYRAFEYMQSQQAKINELQTRIDEALRHVVNHGGYDDLTHVINILKGNKDEN